MRKLTNSCATALVNCANSLLTDLNNDELPISVIYSAKRPVFNLKVRGKVYQLQVLIVSEQEEMIEF